MSGILLLRLGLSAGLVAGAVISPELAPGHENEWRFARGEWRLADGLLEQKQSDRGSAAILLRPAFADFTMTVDFNIRAAGAGVRAASLIFRAGGTMSYYWLHLDSRNDNAILVRSGPTNTWQEIKRARCVLDNDTWHTARLVCEGHSVRLWIDGEAVLEAEDAALTDGRIGLGTSQGRVAYRRLSIEGTPMEPDQPLAEDSPPHRVISRGQAAGSYQAFPDACRLRNGDILCVFYAGYGHVSMPNDEWPKGGRICMVRSRDEGATWSEPEVLFDDPDDNRDPHIAPLSDGTLVCTFFSLYPDPDGARGWRNRGAQLVRSTDGGRTWSAEAEPVAPGWAVSAPVRQMPDGTCILGLYQTAPDGSYAYGGVTRSTDGGKTWSEPIPIGREARLPLDAETDVILLNDGTLFAALRSSKVHMHWATSPDLGLTWSPVKDIGFSGHAPHLTRLSNGAILLTHRVPATALHVSRDEAQTWAGPYRIDPVGGAYPSTLELTDGTVLVVYYEEGTGSAIRALRFRLDDDGLTPLQPRGAADRQ